MQVVDSHKYQLSLDPEADELLLVTCYPFDAIQAGGSLRYVVKLQPVAAPERI